MISVGVCFALAFLSTANCNEYDIFPFMNASLSFEDRVKDLVGRLTIDEIVLQMAFGGGPNNGPTPPITRLGILPYRWDTECLSGDVGAGPATSFPISIGMAAAMDYDMLYATARATSDEVRAKNNDAVANKNYNFHMGLSCFSPVLNIMRDPRWGRNQVCFNFVIM
jgi:beta-glucosidase